MTNLIKTCTDFITLASEGMLRIFNVYFNKTLDEFYEIAFGAYLPPPFDVYGDMTVAAFTVGTGIVVVLSYNFLKWLIGLITG